MNAQRNLFKQAQTGLDRLGERLMRVVRGLSSAAFEPCRVPSPVPVPVRRPRPFSKVVVPALLAALMVMPISAFAWHDDWNRTALGGDLVEVRVKVDGETAPLYVRPGEWSKRYVQAFQGRNYSLELRNRTDRRIGVAISVDGINVVNGERSNLGSNEGMYVLDPYERAEIRGWRTSLEQVRRFVFVDEERSYASRTDQANGDMGWIRVHAFRESRPAIRWQRDYRGLYDGPANGGPTSELQEDPARREGEESRGGASNESPAPSAKEQAGRLDAMRSAPQADAFPGTGWGEKRRDVVQRVDFRAERTATDRLVFRYEYASGLRALGIDLRRNRLRDREDGELGFAKSPRW